MPRIPRLPEPGGGPSYQVGGALQPHAQAPNVVDVGAPFQAMAHALGQWARVNAVLTAEDERLDVEAKADAVKGAYAEAKLETEQQRFNTDAPIHPDARADMLNQRMRTIINTAAGTLKYPNSAQKFYNKIEPWAANAMVDARYDALKQKKDEVFAGADLENTKLANDAVYGPSEMIRSQSQKALERNIDALLARGIYTGPQAAAEKAKHLTNIQKGVAGRDFEIADLRMGVVEDLVSTKSERFNLIPGPERLSLAKTMMERLEGEERKRDARAKELAEDIREDSKLQMALEAEAGTLTDARLETVARGLRWKDTDLERIKAIMRRDPAEKEAASTPEILDRVLAATNRLKPTMTRAQIDALHDQFRRTGVGLNTKDWRAALNEIQGAEKFTYEQGKSDVRYRHAQAEQELDRLLGIPTLFDKLEPAKEQARARGYQELRRRSAAFGGQEDPLRVIEEIAPRLQGSMDVSARGDVTKLRGMAAVQGFQSKDEVESAFRAGKINRGQRDNLMKIFMDVDEIIRLTPNAAEPAQPQKTGTKPKRREGKPE